MIRVRTRLAGESGFTLTELLVAMLIGSIVLIASMTIFINGIDGAARVTDRAESAQRGRLAMDRMVTALNAQTCVGILAPIQAGGNGSFVRFTADLGDATFTPRMYELRYDATARTLTERVWNGTGTLPNVTFDTSGTPAGTRTLAANILPVRVAGVDQPIFRYFKFQSDGSLSTETDAPLATPLSATNANLVVRLAMRFVATPERTKTIDRRATVIEGQASVASADPEEPDSGAGCE